MLKKVFITLFLSSVVLFSSIQSAFAMRQPVMERSLQILQNAERTLKRARPNKGGHRYKALRHIQDAMYEIRAGIEFANRRPAGGQLKQQKRLLKENRQLRENRQSQENRQSRENILREKRNLKEGRAHEYGERKYTEEDERRKEEEYLKNRY